MHFSQIAEKRNKGQGESYGYPKTSPKTYSPWAAMLLHPIEALNDTKHYWKIILQWRLFHGHYPVGSFVLVFVPCFGNAAAE